MFVYRIVLGGFGHSSRYVRERRKRLEMSGSVPARKDGGVVVGVVRGGGGGGGQG